MKIYNDKSRIRGPVITIGSFDGIHLGHQYLLKITISEAKKRIKRSGLVSFDPIPIQFFHPKFPFLLTTKKEKEKVLKGLGLDFIYYLSFGDRLAKFTPLEFIELIKKKINPAVIVTGPNHRFGSDRKGDIRMLKKEFDEVIVVEPFIINGNPCSSTQVRESLIVGRVEAGWRLLGRPYQISGKVTRGTGQGRGIGVPTINLTGVDRWKILPAEGVYLIRCFLEGRNYYGALSIGEVRSIKQEHSIEAHLFNFHKKAYGKSATIEFLFRLRDLMHFKSSRELKKQIDSDIELAKMILKNL
ncbi:MAG TPA: riboflavin biosynthesis protein RibF [bacterium (Candidatus Stahlbacteria)]|nr:riboflavin biosynthesis protein RibF [Candidatus Stahlbacteria bacterium]